MQLTSARLRLVMLDEGDVSAHTAGIITLVGCASAILGALLPWGEKVLFGISISKTEVQAAGWLLAGIAMFSVCIASVGLLRKPATTAIAIVLILLALTQLGVAIWNGINIVEVIAYSDSRQVAIRTIGTGATLGVLGSLITLAGSLIAWTRRAWWPSETGEGA